MNCSHCEKGEVAYRFTTIPKGSGEPVTKDLCLSCAAELSPYIAKAIPKQSVNQLLEELLKQQVSMEGGTTPEQILPDIPPCGECGLEFAKYKATLMLGCANCYIAFGEHLAQDIRRLQGTDHHGATPPGTKETPLDRQSRLAAMRAELQDCIENEDFQRATYLRDQIKALVAGTAAGAPESGGGED